MWNEREFMKFLTVFGKTSAKSILAALGTLSNSKRKEGGTMQIGVRTHWRVEKALAKRKGGDFEGWWSGTSPLPHYWH